MSTYSWISVFNPLLDPTWPIPRREPLPEAESQNTGESNQGSMDHQTGGNHGEPSRQEGAINASSHQTGAQTPIKDIVDKKATEDRVYVDSQKNKLAAAGDRGTVPKRESSLLPSEDKETDPSKQKSTSTSRQQASTTPRQQASTAPKQPSTPSNGGTETGTTGTATIYEQFRTGRSSRSGHTDEYEGRSYPSSNTTVSSGKGSQTLSRSYPKDGALNSGSIQQYKSQCYALQQENKRLQHDIGAYKQKIEELTADIATLTSLENERKAYINEITNMNEELERNLKTARQDLISSRAFVSTEGTHDAQSLLQQFDDLNNSIDSFAYQLLSALEESFPESPIESSSLEALLAGKDQSQLYAFANVALDTNANTGDFIIPYLQYSLCRFLANAVFEPFFPGSEGHPFSTIEQIYPLIKEREPQERWARWRSMTYSTGKLADPSSFQAIEAEKFFQQISTNLSKLVAPHILHWESHSKRLHGQIQAIIKEAMEFKDRAMVDYMSFDYDIFVPSAEDKFDPTSMQVIKGSRKNRKASPVPSNALLTVALGLFAEKNTLQPDGKVASRRTITTKATVLSDVWTPSM